MENKDKTIIVDIDGTIADPRHRLGLIETRPRRWEQFIAESVNDSPYHDIVWLVKTLHSVGCRVIIVTARSEKEREVTTTWLENKSGLKGIYEKIYMRETGDFRNDAIVKKELLEDIYSDGYIPYLVLDDRNSVVDMWRTVGLRCLQVQPGDF